MTWYPIAFLPPQYSDNSGEPFTGAVLKAYAAATNTPIPLATSYQGTTLADSFALNAAGYPVSGGAVVIPHVQQNYKLALYPSQAAANANSGALWTVDDIQIAQDTNQSFFQSFSGDGSTTHFTLSSNLGIDENALMVFADKKFGEYSTNGAFTTDAGWTKGAGWTISGGTANAAAALSTELTQNAAIPIVKEESYTITYTITRAAGSIAPSIGGVNGVTRNAAGTYTETIIAGSSQELKFTTAGFQGTVDNVSVHRTTAARREVLRPNEFTVNGFNLDLNEAPAGGVSNILVFAPSLLFGAVGSLAAAAATSEANAAGYATQANTARAAAEAARDATLAAYDSFDDRYLGAKSTDPTLDNDGNALVGGTLYFNSVSNIMKIYTGSAWVAAYVSGGGALQAVNNLSDLNNAGTARSNLGLGALAVKGQIVFTDIATAAIATLAELLAGTANKLINAATLKASGYQNRAYVESGTVQVSVVTVPADNTIPQKAEGQEILSVNFTPKSATSKVRVRFVGEVASDLAARAVAITLFDGVGTDAIAAGRQTLTAGADAERMVVSTEYTPGNTNQRTYSANLCRLGASDFTASVGGGSTGGAPVQNFGGVNKYSLTVEEVSQ